MTEPTLVAPGDSPDRKVEKLLKISDALMRRVEQAADESGAGYAHFQRAVVLERQVRDRTRDLERTLTLLNESNARLAAANDAEQQARAALSNALEAVQEGFALFGPDDRMVMHNSRFCRQMPDVWERLTEGMGFDDYVDMLAASAHLDSSESGDAARWAERRRALHREDHAMFNVRCVDGPWLQVSEHRTPDGGTAIIQTDVTDMILLERAERDKMLGAQERMVRATLDHIHQGVAIFDAEARLAGWNRRLGALLTPPMHLVRVGAPFALLFDHIVRGAVFSGGAGAEDLRIWAESKGARAPIALDMARSGIVLGVHAEETPDGGFVVSFTDVTAERRAAAALHEANETLERRVRERTEDLREALSEAERANASKSRFVAAASHDLLQPLSAAKLFVSSLDAMGLDGPAASAAQRAEKALGSVEAMLGALLDISRLDSGKAEMKIETVDLGALLAQMAEEFAPFARARGLRLSIRPCRAAVLSDAAHLRRILQNLIANALRYTQRGGVLVGARPDGDRLRVEVWDTGPGVPEDRRADIFREFQRLDDGGAAEGMGLGLAIVERAAAVLGHDLKLKSEVGRGSCFSIAAPVAAPPDAPEPGAPARRSAGANTLVLIVEDNEELSAALALQLETWGFAAFEARSGGEAAALLEETGVAPDVILADYALGNGETGLEALRALRAAYGAIPAAIVTASPAPEMRAACRREGLQVIAKPIDEAALFAFVARSS